METANKLKEFKKYEFIIECKDNYFNIFAKNLSGEEISNSLWNNCIEDGVKEIIQNINLLSKLNFKTNENVKREYQKST